MWPFDLATDRATVNPAADDLRRRAALARAVILGTPVEEPPAPDQSRLSEIGRGILNRVTGGLVPTYSELPPMPSLDPVSLAEDQRRRYEALSAIERGLATTSHPENLRHYSGDALKLLFPQREYQAIRSGDRAVLYNPNDPNDVHPIEESYNLSPGAGHYVGTTKVSEQPASVEMDPISRVNAGLRAGTLSKEQADAYIRKLTTISEPPVMVVPSGDGSGMEVVPRRVGTTFTPAGSPISQADRTKAAAAWQQFDAHLRANPGLLEKGPGEAVMDFGIATSVSDPEAIKYLKLDPRYQQLFADEAPLGTPKAAATPAPSAPEQTGGNVIEGAVDAVTRLGRDPAAVVERAKGMLGRDLTPEERTRILQAGMSAASAPELPPPAAVVTPDQGSVAPSFVAPVAGAGESEAALRAKLATETDPQRRAEIATRIRALRAQSPGAAR